jgi:SAM-dependent methyltransferase
MNIDNRIWIEKKSVLNKDISFLEVGSFIVTGQESIQCRLTIAPKVKKFIGLDLRPGPGVDVVADAKNIPFEDKSFDIVVCLDTLEHIDWPRDVIQECFRVTKIDGFLFLASVFQFPIHEFPYDYWRFTPFCIKHLLEDAGYEVLEYEGIDGPQQSPMVSRGIGKRKL